MNVLWKICLWDPIFQHLWFCRELGDNVPLNSSALSIFLAVRYASVIGIERSKEIEAKEGYKFSWTRQTRSVVFLCFRTRPFCACRKNPDENKLETSHSLMIAHNIAEGVETVKFSNFKLRILNLRISNIQIFKYFNTKFSISFHINIIDIFKWKFSNFKLSTLVSRILNFKFLFLQKTCQDCGFCEPSPYLF